ncbi:histidine phosphatase family protein [Phormidesmis sp. 146-35]
MATRVILVRHGQSTYNAEKRYQGCCDKSVLTEAGLMMAQQTRDLLKHTKIHAAYSSPLQRTQQTAIAILQNSRLELNCHDHLKEIAMPTWEGLPFQYVRQHFAEDYQCWKERPHEFQMQLAEAESSVATLTEPCFPVLDLYVQAQQFWKEVIPRHIDETILIISHGGTIRALIGTAIGIGCQTFHTLQQSNCGVSVLEFPQGLEQPATLRAMNHTQHLGESLPKLKEGKLGLRLLLIQNSDSLLNFAKFLKSVSLDFYLSCDRINVTQELAWQMDSESLMTGVATLSPSLIRQLLAHTLEIPADSSIFDLEPGTMSILHYPINHRPVLQAFNFIPNTLL